MDISLRNALIYSAWPAAIALAGGVFAIIKLPPAGLSIVLRRFAAGAVLGIIAIELLPDVLRAHPVGGIIAFGLGISLMIVAHLLIHRWERARGDLDNRLPSLVVGALTSVPLVGLLIGSGFVAGFREGQLFTLVSTVTAPAMVLALITTSKKAGMKRGKLMLTTALLAGLIIFGAFAGARLLWGRASIDLDLFLAFCLASLLLRAMESLVESYEDHASPWGLAVFFAGVVLFLLLGRSLGGEHPTHPGVRMNDQRSSQMESPEMDAYCQSYCSPADTLRLVRVLSGRG